MDFGLSEEQQMIRTVARDFLTARCPKTFVKEMEGDEEGFSRELWKEMAEMGWLGLVFPEEYGGSDMSFLELAILLEEVGRACLPGPFVSTVVLSGLPILDLGREEQKREFLPQIAAGKAIVTLALNEARAKYDAASINVEAKADGDYYVINGTKLFVPDAVVADYLLCAARTDGTGKPEQGITLFLVTGNSPGISCSPLKTMAGDKLYEVVFDHVRTPGQSILGHVDLGWKEVWKIIERAALAKCCEMVGYLQQMLEMTVSYAKERKQFEHPIGSFQAIQHYCANMAIDVDSARFVTYQAAWKMSKGLPCSEAIAIAKGWVNQASQRVVALAHQVHGGIGFTMDYDLQFYTRRAKAAEVTFGDADFCWERLASEMGL